MQTIILETEIAAPIERCFLLSLSIDLHLESTAQTGEQAIGGVTHGLIGPGETVKWRGRHFGFTLTHESIISAYEKPHHFRDEMIAGMFRSFVHDHYFRSTANNETRMRDELRFVAPLGPLGLVAERAVLSRYFKRFLEDRNSVIKRIAESPAQGWMKYISHTATESAFESRGKIGRRRVYPSH